MASFAQPGFSLALYNALRSEMQANTWHLNAKSVVMGPGAEVAQ